MPRESPPLPDDPIYRAILLVLVASILLGAVVTIVGDLLWHSPGLSQAGTWFMVVTGGIYVFFRVLGAREARRRTRTAVETSESEDRFGPRGDAEP